MYRCSEPQSNTLVDTINSVYRNRRYRVGLFMFYRFSRELQTVKKSVQTCALMASSSKGTITSIRRPRSRRKNAQTINFMTGFNFIGSYQIGGAAYRPSGCHSGTVLWHRSITRCGLGAWKMAEMCRPTAGPMARFDWPDWGELIKMGFGSMDQSQLVTKLQVSRLKIIIFVHIKNF